MGEQLDRHSAAVNSLGNPEHLDQDGHPDPADALVAAAFGDSGGSLTLESLGAATQKMMHGRATSPKVIESERIPLAVEDLQASNRKLHRRAQEAESLLCKAVDDYAELDRAWQQAMDGQIDANRSATGRLATFRRLLRAHRETVRIYRATVARSLRRKAAIKQLARERWALVVFEREVAAIVAHHKGANLTALGAQAVLDQIESAGKKASLQLQEIRKR